MKKILFRLITLFFLFLMFQPVIVLAQKLEYGIKYEGIGDNREFSSKYSVPETIFGSRLGAVIGTNIDSIHQFKAGLSYFYEYGSTLLELKPQLIVYYSMQKGNWGFTMGAFPRRENIHLPYAFISEKYEYYNPTVDGLLVKYNRLHNHMNLFVDWVSRQDSVRREQFMAGFFAKQNAGNFLFDEYWYMFHNAHNLTHLPGENIEDYMGTCILAGYDFSGLLPLDIFTVKTGMLASFYRNRGETMDYNFKPSLYTEIVADYKGAGVELFMKFGSEHQFSNGDDFINNAKNYVRTKLYFTPINFGRIQGRFSWSLHVADGNLDNQQQFSLVYLLNQL